MFSSQQRLSQKKKAAKPSSFDSRPFAVQRKPAIGIADEQTRQELYQAYLQRKERDSKSSSNISFAPSKPWIEPEPVQTKLTIGKAGDKYEQEADEVAENVVKTINTPKVTKSKNPLQRQETEENKGEVSSIGSKSTGSVVSSGFERELNQAKTGGKSLEPKLQAKMENAMGADFSGVKIHIDTKSDQLNHAIQAKAFTTGKDIFFKKGEYNPSSQDGMKLVAHELTHVQQQSGSQLQRKVIQRDEDGDIQLPPAPQPRTPQPPKTHAPMVINGKKEPTRPLPPLPPNVPAPSISESHGLKSLPKPPKDTNYEAHEWQIVGPFIPKRFRKIKNMVAGYNKALNSENKNYYILYRLTNNIILESSIYLDEYENSSSEKKQARVRYIDELLEKVKEERNKLENSDDSLSATQLNQDTKLHYYKNRGGAATAISTINNEGIEVASGYTARQYMLQFTKVLTGTNQTIEQGGITGMTSSNLSLWEAFSVGTKSLGSLLSYGISSLLAIPGLVTQMIISFNRWKNFRNTKQKLFDLLQEKIDRNEPLAASDLAIEDAMKHGVGKLLRQFITKLNTLLGVVINMVGEIAAFVGQVYVTAITRLATTTMLLTKVSYRKIKGLWKLHKGTRGKHRRQSAETLIQQAMDGDEIALQAIVDLNPLSIFRRTANAATQGMHHTVGKYENRETWLPVLNDTDDLKEFLIEIRNEPEKYGIGVVQFTDMIANTLKSQ